MVEVLSSRELHHHPALTRLGPDLLSPSLDPRTAREGLQRRPEVEIGVALMDQTAVAGVGKSLIQSFFSAFMIESACRAYPDKVE